MRWQSRQVDDMRTRTAFLWFPKHAPFQQYRWLEVATWVEVFDGDAWRVVEWLDDEPIPYTITEKGRAMLEGRGE